MKKKREGRSFILLLAALRGWCIYLKVKAENGLVRILKDEGVDWASTFPSSPINNACGEEGINNLMMRTERFAVAVADGFSRVSNGKSPPRGTRRTSAAAAI